MAHALCIDWPNALSVWPRRWKVFFLYNGWWNVGVIILRVWFISKTGTRREDRGVPFSFALKIFLNRSKMGRKGNARVSSAKSAKRTSKFLRRAERVHKFCNTNLKIESRVKYFLRNLIPRLSFFFFEAIVTNPPYLSASQFNSFVNSFINVWLGHRQSTWKIGLDRSYMDVALLLKFRRLVYNIILILYIIIILMFHKNVCTCIYDSIFDIFI